APRHLVADAGLPVLLLGDASERRRARPEAPGAVVADAGAVGGDHRLLRVEDAQLRRLDPGGTLVVLAVPVLAGPAAPGAGGGAGSGMGALADAGGLGA